MENIQNYTGLACPEPVIRCKAYITEKSPAIFTALVDNEPAMENLSRLLKKSAYAVDVTQESDKLWKLIASKHGGEKAEDLQKEGDEVKSTKEVKESYKTLLVLSSQYFGNGDDELGRKLMENFLSTMPEFGKELLKVIMLNSGVKLATTEGKALDALKNFEASGIEILVCGSCLEHFKLTKERKVGETTNMLDVVTAMQVADKVIKI